MKRFFGILISFLVLYVIFYDLKHGTLPGNPPGKISAKAPEYHGLLYFEKKAEPGDTVLSVIEKSLKAPLTVPISQVTTDFKLLNNGIKPEEMQIGKTYKFPDYHSIP